MRRTENRVGEAARKRWRGDESWGWRLVAEKATVVGCRNRVAKRWRSGEVGSGDGDGAPRNVVDG